MKEELLSARLKRNSGVADQSPQSLPKSLKFQINILVST